MNPTTSCKNCGISSVEAGYSTPLCRRCRDILSCRPLPMWINLVILGVGIAIAFGLVRLPSALKAGVAYARAKKLEKRGDYAAAIESYRVVLARYPDNTDALARLGLAEYRAGRVRDAVTDLQKLSGRETSSEELVNEINGVMQEIQAKYGGGASEGSSGP